MLREGPRAATAVRARAATMLVALVGALLVLPATTAPAWSDVEAFSWSDDFANEEGVFGDFRGFGDPARFQFFDGSIHPDVAALSVIASSTSDPLGVLVVAERHSRASSYFFGAFQFSAAGSDPLSGVLHVQDGDTVSVTYHGAGGADGLRSSIHRSWFADTRVPDFREVGFVAPDDAPVTVRGAARAAPANSLIRLYDAVESAEVMATTTADSAGRFQLDTDAALTSTVAVSAQEPGLPESGRLSVEWARVTGRVVLPDAHLGVRSALVEVRAEGDPDPCAGREGCIAGGHLSDRDGYVYTTSTSASFFSGDPGRYEMRTHPQDVPKEAHYLGAAYSGSGPFPVTLEEGTATADAGDMPLLGPNLTGFVRDQTGTPVIEAMIDFYDERVEIVPNTGTYSQHDDGRFAVHLPDGDHTMRVRGPFGCVGYAETVRTISVRGGVANPSHLDVVLQVVGLDEAEWSIPLDPPEQGVVVGLGGAGLTLRLDGADGPGLLSVHCTSAGWDQVTAVSPPIEIDWDGGFDQADVCLRYRPERAQAAGLSTDELQLLHLSDDGQLTALPLDPGSDGAELCGPTDSFSSFAVGVPRSASPAPAPAPAPTSATTPQARTTDDACPSGVPEDGFTDVPQGGAHEAAIDCIVWWRVAQGRTAQSYAPAADVTRAQMATFIANLIITSGGALPAARRDHFDDDDGERHEDSINRLAEAGIVTGQADGRYCPGLPVRRDQMASFLVRATERRIGALLPRNGDFFTDDDDNTHELRIDQAASAGFTGGAPGGGYSPAALVRRDQMGSFLARVLDLLVEQHGAALP
jgi:hypothetical protein